MYWTDERLSEHGLRPPPLRRPRPEGPPSIAAILEAPLREHPDAPASIGRYERLTFAQLDRAVNAACAYLASLGVREGDRVAATTANHTDIVTAFLAVQRMGAMWVGVNRKSAPGEKRHFLSDSEARVYLADGNAAEQATAVRAELPELSSIVDMEPGDESSAWRRGLRVHDGTGPPDVEIDPWAPAGIAYTSGTTGFPKGVVHSQHNMLLAAWVANVNSGETSKDVIRGTALPITIQNLMILGPVAAFIVGARHVCMDRIDAEGVAEWIEAEGVTAVALVPTVVRDLLTLPAIRPEALSSLRALSTGAAFVAQALPGLYRERFGRKLSVGYGITESPTGVAATHEHSPNVQGAIGRPHFHLEVSIQDDQGERLPPGEPGEICFRAIGTGPWANVYAGPLGYWRQPEATAKLWRGGWVRTGDIGSRDEAGELFIHDRRVDLIIRGGANIYPAEVERVLRSDSRVRDAAVVGKPDDRLGEVVAAFIETYEPQDHGSFIAELTEICAGEIADYKIPVEWRLVDALPRNAMGKILKPELRERLKKTAPA